ncbi:protein of unknown function [Taphrina deformans PYCC 5710]|uniref:RGS domain-containing protein n=1 Tax=Taphrina deformans (strain PYCC 5710 / ATCC 11124 / CBS 356.35 / IMI 108563 / JCM 9778 / NBRC 8474) TaxID=1097556 RepID=R4XGT4_TAPDE|nr:protein of unknown function [Taphrina deformans PYCC 5710]|eukprot:CCG85006.1 protein of unknown function [Taphrina deformans PYCC 5710]
MRAPTLAEVLTNQAPPPYSLSAFMAFLSQNHCLETLEFTLDASRYQTHYYSLPQIPPMPGSEESERLRVSWERLIASYIKPGAQREVNLPSSDRDFLLRIPNTYTPPSPEALDSAVYKITELMRESTLSMDQQQQQQQQRQFAYTNQMNIGSNQSFGNGYDARAQMFPTQQQQQQAANNGMDLYNDMNRYKQNVSRQGFNTSGGSGLPPQGGQMNYQQQASSQFNSMQQYSIGQQPQSSSGLAQLFQAHGRRISRPGSARPTSVPSADFLQSVDSWSTVPDIDSEMSGSEDPITPPHTPPGGSSPGNGGPQWRSKIKNQFSKMNTNRSKSREAHRT